VAHRDAAGGFALTAASPGMGSAAWFGMTDLEKLREKLCRELSQSEHSAIVQPRREAKRLGPIPPAAALCAIADHAEAMRPRFDALVSGRRANKRGVALGRAIGELFSTLRHGLFDRLIDTERSYRATLLGVDHGIDLVRMLRAVANRAGDDDLGELCEAWLPARVALIERAQAELAWFAGQPALALQSGLRRVLS
jgi:hypothetical protein